MAAESKSGRPRDVLIVDDDPIQAYLFERMLRELGLEHRCFHAAGGPEALDFLLRRSAFQNAPRPDLIILDLNMPRMDGCAVLREIKADAKTQTATVPLNIAGIQRLGTAVLHAKSMAHCSLLAQIREADRKRHAYEIAIRQVYKQTEVESSDLAFGWSQEEVIN